MSTPTDPRPTDDSKVASIAWAVATIVVALVAGLIAWLTLGQDDDGGPTNGAAPSSSAPMTGPSEPGASEPSATTPAPDAAAETVPVEMQQMLLDLQRRDADDLMAVGEVDAPVVMIEYADYRCPYCARFALQTRPELQGLVDDGTLRIEFRDLVLFDEPSMLAAVAARAAAEQGHLEDYQQALFALSTEGHGEVTTQVVLDLAEEVGVEDIEAFEQALTDEGIIRAVQADTSEAQALGVGSTPTFVVNTAVVQGAQDASHFTQVIEQERAKALAAAQG